MTNARGMTRRHRRRCVAGSIEDGDGAAAAVILRLAGSYFLGLSARRYSSLKKEAKSSNVTP